MWGYDISRKRQLSVTNGRSINDNVDDNYLVIHIKFLYKYIILLF